MPAAAIQPVDQLIGTGDGATAAFQLLKQYGNGGEAYDREIAKPVEDSVMVAVGGIVKVADLDYAIDHTTGIVTFLPGREPQTGEQVHAGFEFDVPVRFDADEIAVNLKTFLAGDIASIPIVEIFP